LSEKMANVIFGAGRGELDEMILVDTKLVAYEEAVEASVLVNRNEILYVPSVNSEPLKMNDPVVEVDRDVNVIEEGTIEIDEAGNEAFEVAVNTGLTTKG
jgi:hypothetical protein